MSDQALGRIAFGEFVALRGRKWLSQGAEQLADELNVLRLSCIEDDAQGEEATAIWDSEIAAHTATDALWGANGSEGSDTAATFSARLKTVDWNSTSVADKALFQAPFRAGIRLDPYQLAPLQKALDLPRVNMLIADDVGLVFWSLRSSSSRTRWPARAARWKPMVWFSIRSCRRSRVSLAA